MAAEVGLFSCLNPSFKLPNYNPFSPPLFQTHAYLSKSKKMSQKFRISANLGGGGEGKGGKRKFITKEEEPEQYWQTAGEREGENPMKTPLPYIIIFDEDKLPHKENHQSTPVQEHALISSPDCSDEDVRKVLSAQAKTDTISQKKTQFEDNGQGFLIRSHDLYSESESMDQYSSSSSEYHSSDIEWPYNMGQRLDCSDDSISDEESLIEIAIPTGQFVSPEKDLKLNLKCCKLSKDFSDDQETIFEKDNFLADYINEMNEEDNLIEIDIYMGSIKYSSFDS
ncbi:hypothetical protein CDL12_06957 [Handroanthus impetiginosus]|uniref:Uncharacterized protein n=1 Tax=Handroanthus impetiginosus TaxID=429701 RepID=A0A2G9HS62_9LAMI|nr:hypothetical protein CDL12_06957 [Handroanthus impetiginosus]